MFVILPSFTAFELVGIAFPSVPIATNVFSGVAVEVEFNVIVPLLVNVRPLFTPRIYP